MIGIETFKNIDKRQLWRFFVDGRFHKKYNGWVGFEKQEHGSTQALINAYEFMFKNFDLSNGISCHYLRNIHHTCMFNVYSTLSESAPGDLRCEETGFKFFAAGTTIEFLKELFELRKDDQVKLFHTAGVDKPSRELDIYSVYKRLMKRKRLQFNPWYPDLDKETKDKFDQKGNLIDFYEAKAYIQLQFATKMEGIVNRFNEKIKSIDDEDKIILEIARFIQKIELLHPFPDGNCRTFLTLTNHLLLFHGLHPTMIENPNFDGTYSYHEYAHEIRKGIDCTKRILQDPETTLYDYSIKNAIESEVAQFSKMTESLCKTIQNFKIEQKHRRAKNGIHLTADKLQEITGGEWVNYNKDVVFSRVGSHSDIGQDYLCFFVSLEDWRKEGLSEETIIDYINMAVKKHISAIVVDRKEYVQNLKIPALITSNVTAQLKKVAMHVREEVNPQTVLVGGTVGKTGFKLQLHKCLSPIVSTHATLNSGNIKLPILYSLASLNTDDKVEIVEVSGAAKYSWGVNRSKVVSPDICVYTDINLVHMDIHKSIDNLINNKSSAVEGLEENGTCIINNEARFSRELRANIEKIRPDVEIVLFGTSSAADAHIISQKFDTKTYGWNITADIEGQEIDYYIPLFQTHAPLQSLGVLLTVKKLGYDIEKAANNYQDFYNFPTMGRLFKITRNSNEFLFYDQSLRGSIQGMESALNDISRFNPGGKTIAVLGGSSIEEDGEFTRMQHEKLASLVNDSGIDVLYTTGPYLNYFHNKLNASMKSKLVMHNDDRSDILASVVKKIEDKDLVFIMGSAYLRLGNMGSSILSLGEKLQLR